MRHVGIHLLQVDSESFLGKLITLISVNGIVSIYQGHITVCVLIFGSY